MMTESLAVLGPDARVGSYRILREIGRGGMGTVYEAQHTLLPRRAAVKVMHAELRLHPGMATRLVEEAGILEEIRHPGIVRVYECNVLPDHRPWIAMELVDGDTLAQRLHRKRMSSIEVAQLLTEVADVLASVHIRDVVHRDLKPDNLLLTPGDRTYPLRVIDWGVARLCASKRMTLDGLTPGTPIYMSPEQATGRNIGAACDIYSLGVIAYEALAGHPPFDGRTLAEVVCMHLTSEAPPLRCDAPPALCALVHRMLEKDPEVRPTAVELRRLAAGISHELAFDDCVPAAEDETIVIDAEALEFGVTELLPVAPRQPRWTPELSSAVTPMVARAAITPRTPRDQVVGEIVLLDKRRNR
jgi:serine/threonine protein kinase